MISKIKVRDSFKLWVLHRFLLRSNSTNLQVWLYFCRKIYYHLSNTYLPTMSLLAIGELTMFYGHDMGVSLSLTVLLVMYTFYQSISASIPKTAYLKLLDYWLIFCLLVPFLIFLVQSYWCLCQHMPSRAIWVGSAGKTKSNGNQQSQKKFVQMSIEGLTIVFTLAYSLAAVLVYYQH